TVRRFSLAIMEGVAAGTVWESSGDRCSIGSHPSNDLVIEDPTVSRFHCEIAIGPPGPLVRGLSSRNCNLPDGGAIMAALLRPGSVLRLGTSGLRFALGAANNQLPISEQTRFGALIGGSVVMRTTFALLERAAASTATVLLEGETGSGKG